MRRLLRTVFAAALTLGAATSAGAQASALRIRAIRRDTIPVASTLTATFVVTTSRADSAVVLPHLEVPKEWTVLMGGDPFPIAPRASHLVLLGVAVPARTPAGVYPVRVWVTTRADPQGIADSVLVRVPERRAIEFGLVDRPAFVVSGRTYSAVFLLRNRGNAVTAVRLEASALFGVASLSDSTIRLEPEESRVVRATVRTRRGVPVASDDVLEVLATSAEDALNTTAASARVTVIPEPNDRIAEYLTVPTQVDVRAASANGVSPFEVAGRGKVRDDGSMGLDFLFRGAAGGYSPFGERDEYRAELSGRSWRARAGDHLFAVSSLTSAAQPGFGVGADGARGIFALGAFGQQFRHSRDGREAGAFLSARPRADARFALQMVQRSGGPLEGQVASAAASLRRDRFSGEIEVARSGGVSGNGLARSARASGGSDALTYDVGHLYADTGFAGSQRGAARSYVTASTHHWESVSFAMNASSHRSDLTRATGRPYYERLDLAALSATLGERVTLELGAVRRATTLQGTTHAAEQHSLRARADQSFAFGTVSFEGEAGQAHDDLARLRRYTEFALTSRHSLARGTVSAWVGRYSGGSITRGADGNDSFGGDAALRLGRSIDLTLLGFAVRNRGQTAGWHSQLDAQIAHLLPIGSTITVRARLLGGAHDGASSQQSVAYVQYGMPLGLPVARLRAPGRVRGHVVDATSGKGIAGALVRLGSQVAITNEQGRVAFGGVPGGVHRVSMSQEASFANAVFVGDPRLVVDSARVRPTTFHLAIARSARVAIEVRRFALSRGGFGATDALIDAGPLANAMFALEGARDTLFRASDAEGTLSFQDVPPGKWHVSVRGDAPAFHSFEPDRAEVILAPGETKALTFRLLQRRREVEMLGHEQELRPTIVIPKSQVIGTAPR